MSRVVRTTAALVLAAAATAAGGSPAGAAGTPTCADVLDIDVHGHHVVADYVMGSGHHDVDWPPAGHVGSTVGGHGAAVPGGPGPGFHFPAGVAPGASFCNPQARSGGWHAGG